MTLKYNGKTKDVFDLGDGKYLLKFKDDATVGEDGKIDPGGNQVGAVIEGMGNSNLRLAVYFFEKIEKAGIKTQYISSDIKNNTMTVKQAVSFGYGIEVICRFKAVGSFIRRYGKYIKDGENLAAFVEITLKDDERNDPPITKEGLEALNILKHGEYEKLVSLTKNISQLIKDEFAQKGIELYDIKLEFGKAGDEILLIDEISGGSLRAFKDGKQIAPLELEKLMLS